MAGATENSICLYFGPEMREEAPNKIKDYKELQVWQKGMGIARGIYQLTRGFPKEELYGLTSQLRRAGFSIPANIAEGWGRNSKRSYVYFLKISRGSLLELETLLLLAFDLGLLNSEEENMKMLLDSITIEHKMLNSLIKKV